MKTLLRPLFVSLAILTSATGLRAGNETDGSLTKIGQEAPAFECTAVDGKKVTLSELRGKVVVVNFFATWCLPCVAEMPHLEKEIWQKFKGEKFAMVGIGLEHKNKELASFQKKHKVTFPMAGDPKGDIYAKYAKEAIPRTYVIGADGKIAFQLVEYDAAEFAKMVGVIQKELDKGK